MTVENLRKLHSVSASTFNHQFTLPVKLFLMLFFNCRVNSFRVLVVYGQVFSSLVVLLLWLLLMLLRHRGRGQTNYTCWML